MAPFFRRSLLKMFHAALIILASITDLCSSQHFSTISDVRAISELPLERLLQVRNSLLPALDIQTDLQEQHEEIKVAARRLDDTTPTITEGVEIAKTDHLDNTKTEPPATSREDASPRVDVASSKISGAQALPLQAKTAPLNRGGHSGYGYDEGSDKKGGKIQSIFQISVTTLAFLAFGGYLLCLLVQAVKGKQMDATTMAPMVAAFYRPRPPRPNNRRRTTRRPPRSGPNRRPSYRDAKGAKGGKRRGGKVGRRGEVGGRSRREAEVPPLEALQLDHMYDSLISLSEAYVKYHTIDYKFYNATRKLYN